MGIFSNKNLSENQVATLNNILPKHFQKSVWSESDFKGTNSIYARFDSNLSKVKDSYTEDGKQLKKLLNNLNELDVKSIIIYNTEPFGAELLGMVDVGIVERFGTASTGDRFSNGAIGYAIESAIDDTWAKNNAQENAVNVVKFKLLEKAKNIYPDCNLLFKYQVDFREIGTSGNVFIYMRGTAAKGENKVLEKALKKAKEDIFVFEQNMNKKKEEIQKLQDIKNKIPQSPQEIIKYLGK